VPDDEQKHDDTQPPPQPHDDAAPAQPQAAEGEGEDKFRPEAIAARIDNLGEETELDRIAREEEKKLHERKRQSKKGKRGLEAAASKRLAKIGEVTVKRPSALGDSVAPEADPLLERVRRLGAWIRSNRQLFGGLVTVGLLAVGGTLGWVYWQDKKQADASAMLAKAFADERGQVSTKDEDDDDDGKARKPLYPTFKSAGERRDAALVKYREVQAKYAGTGAAYLARLGEAGLLLDGGDAKGALAAYEDVKGSALAQADVEVRARALEGAGFAHELLAQADVASNRKPDQQLDDALGAYKQLEQVDAKGFKELGMYHEARVLQAKGDKPKAIELLKDLNKRVSEPSETHTFSYLEFAVEDRLRELDPSALPPKAPKLGGLGAGGGAGAGGAPNNPIDMSDPKIQEILRQMQQQQQKKGGPPPGAPK
jgi:hypothetical protein